MKVHSALLHLKFFQKTMILAMWQTMPLGSTKLSIKNVQSLLIQYQNFPISKMLHEHEERVK